MRPSYDVKPSTLADDPHADTERVYREQAERLWRALLGYAGDPELASDAVAEVFAQLLARRRSGEVTSPEGWVWASAFRIAAGLLKARRSGSLDRSLETAVELPEPVVDLVGALRRLPDRQRMVVVLHDYGDRPVDEVAAILGIAPATVYVHLGRARAALRGLLEDRDDRAE